MSKAIQITPRLWQLKMGNINAYLITSDDGLILVDSGWPNQADEIFSAVRMANLDPLNIKHLVLTHGHGDHAGSGAEIVKRTGAKVYAHQGDLDLITGGHAEHKGTKVSAGVIPYLLNQIFIKPYGVAYEPFNVDFVLKEGDRLPMAPDIEVINTPGHSAGHLCFLMHKDSVLIAADICANTMGLGNSILYEDKELTRKSILKAAALPFDIAVFGHGPAIMSKANQKLKKKFS